MGDEKKEDNDPKDSFGLIREIEKIYNETFKLIKNKKQGIKNIFCASIYPPLFFLCISLALLIISVILKCIFIYFPAQIMYVLSIFWLHHNQKQSLKIQYGITDNDDVIVWHKAFKERLLIDENVKKRLIQAKNILEIETREEQNPLTKYFTGYISLILIPVLFILFEDYLKTNIEIIPYVIVTSFFLLFLTNIINILTFNRKQNTKKAILKKIERIIIEEQE
jgi:hypothetical protein